MESSLRDRKKTETFRSIFQTAVELFAEYGYDNVSVAAIAEAAGVSKMTVFNYFGSKEELIFHPVEQHVEDMARAVRDRPDGATIVDAVRNQFVEAMSQFDPSTGLTDNETVAIVRHLMYSTPALLKRSLDFVRRSEELLVAEIVRETGDSGIAPIVIAGQLASVRWELTRQNCARMSSGESKRRALAAAHRDAEVAFSLVEDGIGSYGRR